MRGQHAGEKKARQGNERSGTSPSRGRLGKASRRREGKATLENVGGRRTLTPFGRERLAGWQDLTVHVPVLEYEFENELRGYNPDAKKCVLPSFGTDVARHACRT